MKKIRTFILDNLVVVLFVAFTTAGFIVAGGVSPVYFISELIDRVSRNFFLVLSLIIPVIAGLGLNFGIVVGAIAGQFAIIFFRYHAMGGISTLLLCFLCSLPLAVLFGWLTGMLYNRVRGQEMIASLIVGYFAQGIYYFVLLFAVGYIIPVTIGNTLIMFNGIGVRMSIDMGAHADGGMKYALDYLVRVPFLWLALVTAVLILAYILFKHFRNRNTPGQEAKGSWRFKINIIICAAVIVFTALNIALGSSLTMVKQVPLITVLVLFSLCMFITFLNNTKLGQDFRSVGQNQHIAEVSGINVDRTRIIATVFSTVFAAWGMIIYLQNMGTMATYDSHRQIGLFSVAAILVGGASTSRASVKNALMGAALFNSMTIISPELGLKLFGDAGAGEYFRSFMVYGVIGLSLGLYVWKQHKAAKEKNAL